MPHIHEKIDFTVEVFIVYKDKVLLRKHDKYNFWLSIGGHIELNEDPNQAAVREVKEEVGLDVELIDDLLPFQMKTGEYQELIPPKFTNRHNISNTHEHVTFTYFGKVDSNKIIPENKDDTWKWFPKKDLERNKEGIKEHILFYAKQALGELSVK